MKNATWVIVAVTCIVILTVICSIGICTVGLLLPDVPTQ